VLEDLEKKSALGDPEAQFQLAQVLQHGLGVRMDEDAALELYHAAAEQGYERAQYALGEIYMEGRITPQDLIQSYVWFSKVRRGGNSLSKAAAESCEYLDPHMTPEQRAEAMALTSAVDETAGNGASGT
tara:strand:+ start:9350 stop:9736 length:387 start_codon:yes stop_codon:yes gene_type:complete